MFIYSVVSVNSNIVRYNRYLVVVTVVVVLSVIVIVIVTFLEHSTVVVGVFKFKFEYSIYSIFRGKSLIVLGLFHYKYCGEYLLCGRLQWERTAVESLNFLTLCRQQSSVHGRHHARVSGRPRQNSARVGVPEVSTGSVNLQVGLGRIGSKFSAVWWIGSRWVSQLVGCWVGLGQRKWTHRQLWGVRHPNFLAAPNNDAICVCW